MKPADTAATRPLPKDVRRILNRAAASQGRAHAAGLVEAWTAELTALRASRAGYAAIVARAQALARGTDDD